MFKLTKVQVKLNVNIFEESQFEQLNCFTPHFCITFFLFQAKHNFIVMIVPTTTSIGFYESAKEKVKIIVDRCGKVELLDLAEWAQSDEPSEPSRPTRSTATRDGLGFYESAKEKVKTIVDRCGKAIPQEEDFKISVNTAINSVVRLLKDVVKQGLR